MNTPAVANLIAMGKSSQIYSIHGNRAKRRHANPGARHRPAVGERPDHRADGRRHLPERAGDARTGGITQERRMSSVEASAVALRVAAIQTGFNRDESPLA